MNKNSTNSAVEKLDFGKPFSLKLGKKARIGKLSISFKEYYLKEYYDPFGSIGGHCEIFIIVVSEGKERKEIMFRDYADDRLNELQSEWKDYQFSLLAGTITEEKILKMKIEKINSQ
jgi:hypothetical protein